ncbi:related to sulphate transporter proteins [Cephalotrichum gorgonifer]|uniref:Related to sulphate transporter proteins n=1 Tax=Cephalotrichum gorgonifer TaxID=2041049 RepID=A0AAE8MY94_9PEZI|nr:related to sulphate transporter proteins [Cephalotrichum gorgonifer]
MAFSDSDSPGSFSSAGSGQQGRPAGTSTRRSAASRSQQPDPSETSSLLQHLDNGSRADSYEHGTFAGSDLLSDDEAGVQTPDTASAAKGPSWRARLSKTIKSKKVQKSRVLAREAGVEYNKIMLLSYYIPCLSWLRQYKTSYISGDLIAALSVASIYLPMVLSFADSLAHVPPINGLYSFVFNPLIYAIFGSSPALMVGPDATASLLVGTVVKGSVDLVDGDSDPVLQAKICGVIAGMAGCTILVAGLARLGFLDSVFSRPFLRGFISAVGFVIFVEQLLPELGLVDEAKRAGVSHGSSVEKLTFLARNIHKSHHLTVIVSATAFVVLLVTKYMKKYLQPRYPSVAYIPDRLIIVVIGTILCAKLDWETQGVAVLGAVKAASGHLFTFRWPFQPSHMKHIREAMSTSFLIALLGFFESTVTAKSLGGSTEFPDMQLSANRELVALGAANLVGGCFMSLPAFGGYGKSKVKAATGGKSPMACVFLSVIALLTILFIVPYMYYLPKPVLSSMISVVALSLIEEAPGDVLFFFRIHGWAELGLMAIIFFSTIFYSVPFGIAIGIGLSLLQVIRHSTRPRIQILGRTPGTHRFENAETAPDSVEFIDGCLIVKIPEPLTFANTGELKTRLRRLEIYGTSMAHPALPRLRRPENNKNIIFDIKGVTSMDGSGAQVLEDIVRSYREKGARVFFSRGPKDLRNPVRKLIERSGIMSLIGGEAHYVGDIHEALKMTETEEGEPVVVAERVRIGDDPSPLLH